MKYNTRYVVHASNVKGLGASQVAQSLIEAMEDLGRHFQILYILPATGGLSGKLVTDPGRVSYVKRIFPNALSRLLECIFTKLYYPHISAPIVLGDIPLRGCVGQVVLMHQPNLVPPSVNEYSSTSLAFRVMRALFRINMKYVHCLVVQTDVIKNQIVESYPALSGKVSVIPMPPPNWLRSTSPQKKKENYADGLKLFYPAAGYPHKNHRLLIGMCQRPRSAKYINEIIVTLEDEVFKKLGFQHELLNNAGRLSQRRCLEVYVESDALFFPSLLESYGLPLVEAMSLGMPVICSDLPYARWVCEDEAVYFDPNLADSALNAICEVRERLSAGWRPDWEKAMSKFPSSWNDVASELLRLRDSYHVT